VNAQIAGVTNSLYFAGSEIACSKLKGRAVEEQVSGLEAFEGFDEVDGEGAEGSVVVVLCLRAFPLSRGMLVIK